MLGLPLPSLPLGSKVRDESSDGGTNAIEICCSAASPFLSFLPSCSVTCATGREQKLNYIFHVFCTTFMFGDIMCTNICCFVKMVETHCVKTYSFRPLRKAIEGEREAGTPRLNATVLSALPPPPPPPPSIPCVQGREKARQATCVYLFTPKMSLPSILHLCLYFPPPPPLCGICGISEGEKEGKYHPAVFEVSLLAGSV